jgi:hypothetical protein
MNHVRFVRDIRPADTCFIVCSSRTVRWQSTVITFDVLNTEALPEGEACELELLEQASKEHTCHDTLTGV